MNRGSILKAASAAALIPALSIAGIATAQPRTSMGNAAKKHATETKRVGSLSLATSRIATSKASDPMVKEFAKWEVAEQETIADILTSAETGKAEGALNPPTERETEANLDAAGRTSLQKLQGLSGADFDKTYIAAQLDGHRQLLAIQEDYLKIGKNRAQLSITKLARGQIREHIDHLEMLRSKLG
ncbi:DUF4142 domain-containing protein [Rhizobium oryzicola]|uniref:DUF4142 domain-containing protein n=1 Tax=Rhizobium oryzicola TaxID=1232668 RepID=A0ABT8SX50_9HYPH|nr:DUF4142 domain-containing protein [Rhizobium oryzicola]MDO1583035.1 DUF4142 domain-containing protein [Rhizobium oryzicola]